MKTVHIGLVACLAALAMQPVAAQDIKAITGATVPASLRAKIADAPANFVIWDNCYGDFEDRRLQIPDDMSNIAIVRSFSKYYGLAGLRIGVAQGDPLDRLDETVGKRFADALAWLGRAGARLSEKTLPLLGDMARVNSKGGVQPAEAFAVHRELLSRRSADIDPNVRARLERARNIGAADYIEMVRERTRLINAMAEGLADVDVVAMPTTPIVAPTMDEVAMPDDFARKNAMLLRNTVIANFFDLCAISLPIPGQTGLPAGLMLLAQNGRDHRLFRIAASVERLFAG